MAEKAGRGPRDGPERLALWYLPARPMRLEPLLQPDRTLILEGHSEAKEVLRELADRAHESLREVPADALYEALVDRERRYPTSTPEGVAFPHAMLSEITDTLVLAALLRPAVAFREGDHPPVDVVFAMFGSASKPFQHVQLLARLARVVRGDGALHRLRAAPDAEVLVVSEIADIEAISKSFPSIDGGE